MGKRMDGRTGERTGDRREGSEPSSGGNSDEHLVHNWSITFSEYATNGQYMTPGRDRAHRSEKRMKKSEKRDDAKTEGDVKGSDNTNAMKNGNDDGNNQESIPDDIDEINSEIVKQSRDVYQNGERFSKEYEKYSNTKREFYEHTPQNGAENENADDINAERLTNSKDEDVIQSHVELDSGRNDDQGAVSKLAPLPPINGRYHSDGPAIGGGSRDELGLVEGRSALSVGLGSGSKPPRNTPSHTAEIGGRVQQVYVRFPGQRTGQMMFAEMNQQAGRVRIVSRDKEKEMLARLSWLLLDAGTSALRTTFDSVHPPLSLREHLSQQHVKSVLKRLQQKGAITEKQWRILYPTKKRHSTSQKYDSRLIITLLETICHLCPPYPHGWSEEPLPKDGSLSADIVRLQLLFLEITRHDTIPGDLYSVMFVQIRDVIVRLGGPPMRMKISRIETELINLDLQQHYIKVLRETWNPEVIRKLEQVHAARQKTSRRRAYADSKGAEEGLSPEDRVTLKKTSKIMVDNVPAEDVLDRLQQSQIIKFSDRQEILAVSKKHERMQNLLDKISESKLPYALKSLFDAMKFKYKKVYDHVMAVRKQVYKEGVVNTIDVVGLTQDALCARYKTMFSRMYPFPWSDTVCGSIRDIYTPLDIVDSKGKKLHGSELLPEPTADGRGQRILVEGSSGSGKTVLCAWLAYMWATQRQYFNHNYQHLLYINTYLLEGNVETAIYKDLLQEKSKITITEFWEMIERESGNVCVIIDGYDQVSNVDLSDILSGSRLKESTVLVTANPNLIKSSWFTPDTKWFNMGFSDVNIRRCFRTCVTVSCEEHEQYEKLYHLAGRESWPLLQHLTNPMLAVKAFATYKILRKGTMMREMKTTCDLLDKYGLAMATQYCTKQKIDIIGFEFPEEVLRASTILDEFAYTCVFETNSVQFTEAEIVEVTNDPLVLEFGAFGKLCPGWKMKFACGISRDFLAARHVADMEYGHIEDTILRAKMIKLPKYMQLMSFLYGQYRQDEDTQILQGLFDQLAARNEYCVRGNYFPTSAVTRATDISTKAKVPRGVLSDFAISLHCLAECPDRPEMVETIATSMPQRLIIKSDSMQSLKCIQGLCAVVQHEECAITELELELHQFQHTQLPLFVQLAKHLGKNRHVHSIKITWSSVDLMSNVLAAVMENTSTVDTVYLSQDGTRKSQKKVSAATWAALQSACNNMTNVQQLSFLNARVTAIVYHVLQHIPTTLAFINLSGCAVNQMCAGEIANHLHGNSCIQSLDLSFTNLRSTEFVAIFQGMQLCESIKHVRIRGADLDRPCVIALAEYIKLTHSLEVLDLSQCQLDTDMCTRLVLSIRQNRTVLKLVFKDTRLTSEGRRVMSNTKSKIQPVHVEGLVEATVY